MPNSEPNFVNDIAELKYQYAYGSAQKRQENLTALVDFLTKWKNSSNPDFNTSREVANRFCMLNMQYGYVSRKDICEQALMKVNLI